MQDVDLEN